MAQNTALPASYRYNNFIILIPALDPTDSLPVLITDLVTRGFNRISVTDDGNGVSGQEIFAKVENLGAVVAHHEQTMGKGTALRTALENADEKLGDADFYITADCDGQHTPEDIERIAEELLAHPDHFVLGVRKFEKTQGKKVSYWVNYFQRMFYRVTNRGKECVDPRSGLRGFPASLKHLALTTEGKSYDYELNFLDVASQVAPTSLVPISAETYTIDKTSHFRLVIDLLGMYIKFWRYLLTSNISTVFDLILFAAFEAVFAGLGTMTIFVATVCARILSGLVGYILNRYISFRSRLSPGREMVRYFIVFFGQMAASGILVSLLSIIPIPNVIVKAFVDFVLFFLCYSAQKNWVFATKQETEN